MNKAKKGRMKGLLPTGAQSRSMWKTFDLTSTPGITGSHLGQIEKLLRGLDFIPEQWEATQGLWVEAGWGQGDGRAPREAWCGVGV